MRPFAGDRLSIDPSILFSSFLPAHSDLRREGVIRLHPVIAAVAARLKRKMVLFRGELRASQCSTLPLWILLPLPSASFASHRFTTTQLTFDFGTTLVESFGLQR
ncbi:hypothetical protein ABVK25_012310 [Lepraria finkii]|uniref:Uncharacterized protein n=1 Tax=Lepraria finkii TaxID=1340010 RepID=A0ABR4AGP9_9LECA